MSPPRDPTLLVNILAPETKTMTTNETTAALPATDDIYALAELHPELVVNDGGTNGEHAFFATSARRLKIYWDTATDDEPGWSWRTRAIRARPEFYDSAPPDDRDSGTLDTAPELANLVKWVTGS